MSDHPDYRLLRTLINEWENEGEEVLNSTPEDAADSPAALHLQGWLAGEKIDLESFLAYHQERAVIIGNSLFWAIQDNQPITRESLAKAIGDHILSALIDGFAEGFRFAVSRPDP